MLITPGWNIKLEAQVRLGYTILRGSEKKITVQNHGPKCPTNQYFTTRTLPSSSNQDLVAVVVCDQTETQQSKI